MATDISSLLSTAATGSASSTSKSGGLADNFQAFLTLLTSQLKNQNPLDPLDTNEFTRELVQFASVEQQIKSNQNLEALVKAANASAAASAVSYIGTSVTASGAAADLKDGTASWAYKLDEAAAQATITIRDADGNVAFTETKPLPAGAGTYQWKGRTGTGETAPAGRYQITIDARDAAGKSVKATTEVAGKVDGVDLSGAEPVLLVGSRRVPLAGITSVRTGGS